MTRRIKQTLALILLLTVLCLPFAVRAEEEAPIPFFGLMAVRSETGRFWLETRAGWYTEDFSDAYGIPCAVITDERFSQERTCLIAQMEKGYGSGLTPSQRAAVAGFYGEGQEITQGRSTESSRILEEFAVNGFPAWRVEMTGQGYEMIWLRDGEDLFFLMYPTADAAFAAQMRETAQTFLAVASPNLAPSPEEDFEFAERDGGAVITAYTGGEARVLVPDTLGGLPVRAVGEKAFYEAPVLEVALPEGVEEIGEYAFSGCTSLVRLRLPSTLRALRAGALESCMRLQWLNLEETRVTEIGESVFWGNLYLESLGLPDTAEAIGGSNFVMCFSLERFDVSPSCAGFASPDGEALFTRDGKTLLHAGCCAGWDGPYAVPEGVEVIWPFALSGCFYLAELTLPASLREIGGLAFTYTGLTELRVPASVTRLGYLFQGGEESQTVIGFPNLTLRGEPGSAAEAYCAAVGMTFVPEGE